MSNPIKADMDTLRDHHAELVEQFIGVARSNGIAWYPPYVVAAVTNRLVEDADVDRLDPAVIAVIMRARERKEAQEPERLLPLIAQLLEAEHPHPMKVGSLARRLKVSAHAIRNTLDDYPSAFDVVWIGDQPAYRLPGEQR